MSKAGVTVAGTAAPGTMEQEEKYSLPETKIGDKGGGSIFQGVGLYFSLGVTARQKIFEKKNTYIRPYLIFG